MARRIRTEIPKPKTFVEFLESKLTDYENENKDIALGTLTGGIWQEYTRGETWDCIRVGSVWEENRFVTIEAIEKEYNFYVEQFENRMNRVLGFF